MKASEDSSLLSQAGPGPEEDCPSLAATVEEPKKGRKPQLDWAVSLRRTFALDVCPDTEVIAQPNGVGLLTALVFLLALEDKTRFKSGR